MASVVLKKFKSPFLQTIYNRVNLRNKNCLIAFVGETGGGKSWSGMSCCEKLSNRPFEVGNIHFSPQDFLHQLNAKQIQKGDWSIIEEMGINNSSRDFWTEQNKKILAALQAFRYLNLGVIFNVPNLTYIDSGSRKLLHYIVAMERIDENKRLAYATVYRVRPHGITGKLYNVFPTYADVVTGERYTSQTLAFPAPSIDLVEKYEQKKRAWGDKLLLEIESFLNVAAQKEASKKLDVKTMVKSIADNPNKAQFINSVGTYSMESICFHFGIGNKLGARVKQALDKNLLNIPTTPPSTQ